jgi:excisionase family DNA binding protein
MAHKPPPGFFVCQKRLAKMAGQNRSIFMTTSVTAKEWLTLADLCELLGIGRTLAYQLIAERTIPAVRIGRAIRVRKADVEKWLAENRY